MTDEYKEIYKNSNVVIGVKDIDLTPFTKDSGKMFRYIFLPDVPSLRNEVYITDSEIAIMNNAISSRRKFWLRLSTKYLMQRYRRNYCGGKDEQ